MHAVIEQLLSLRDGEPVDAQTKEHVLGCAQCATELRRLSLHRRALQSLPLHEAPDAWPAIQAEVGSPPGRANWQKWVASAAVVVIAISIIVAIRTSTMTMPDTTPSPMLTNPQLESLQARSLALENTLQSLPDRPALERAGTAATIDGLEQRIQWLDHHLSGAPSDMDGEQTAQLWEERNALLDTLVKVRYAESGTYVF